MKLAEFAGEERIKISEVVSYGRFTNLSKFYLSILLNFVPALDNVRMKYIAEKREEAFLLALARQKAGI